MAGQTLTASVRDDAHPAQAWCRLITELRPYLRIVHQIEGRVRLKLAATPPHLSPLQAAGGGQLQGRLWAAVPGVRNVAVNALARSCTVEYDNTVIPDAVWSDLLDGRHSPAVERLLALLATAAMPSDLYAPRQE